MSEQSSNIVSKVWGLCNPLRDDGVSYGDYLEQLTYLIFLKMSDEYSHPPYKRETGIPKGYTWSDMNTLKGAELENLGLRVFRRCDVPFSIGGSFQFITVIPHPMGTGLLKQILHGLTFYIVILSI